MQPTGDSRDGTVKAQGNVLRDYWQLVPLAFTLVWSVAAARAEIRRPFLDIPQPATPPVMDGRLDDPCWQHAAVLTNFTQVLPVEGSQPSEATELRVLCNRDCLFLGIRCGDREPDKIIVKQMQRDSSFSSDDMVMVGFDTFFRQREGYYFAFNPAGACTDGLIENYQNQNSLWDTVWQVRAHIDDRGWTAEVAIPFKSLSFDGTQGSWGFNVERIIRRKQERIRWTGLARAKPVTYLADFGELRGLTNLNQGLGLEARPAVSMKYLNDAVNHSQAWRFRPSIDLTYNITPSLKANATFNTDFAETEVDDRVVNLTRFPTFFPEKRDFFLQDSALFRFGGLSSSPLTPFYSRRIGLSSDGQPVDIIAGGRLTGRVNGTRIALLDVQQNDTAGVESKNLFVGRVATPVLGESDVGGILTYGDPRSNGQAALAGLDFNYVNSRLPAGRTIAGRAWVMGSTSDRVGGEDVAFGGSLEYPNEPLDLHFSFRHIGKEFDPALGFIQRRGIRDYQNSMSYVWRPNTAWIRSVALDLALRATTDLDNRFIAEDHDLPSLTITTPAGDELSLLYSNQRDVLNDTFPIWPGIVIPAGHYRMNQYQVVLGTSDARAAGIESKFRYEGFYTGDKTTYLAGFSLRPSRHVTAQATYELDEVRLPEGNFDVRIFTARLNLALTPGLTWSSLAQYENRSDNFGLNSRIRWTFRPGCDLFFVVNQGFDFNDWYFARLNSEVTLKIGATFRL